MIRCAALTLFLMACSANAMELDLTRPRDPKPQTTQPCTSVVLQRCTPAGDERDGGYGELQKRRAAPNLDQLLETVVIEGTRQRKPSLKELLDARAPPMPGVSYEQWKRDDGSVCTCSSPCLLPIILPCCVCSQGGSSSRINGTVN